MTTIYENYSVKEDQNPINAQNKITTNNSDQYKFINSNVIVETLKSQGFELDGTSYAKPRKQENKGFQKHIMIFSRPDLIIDDGNKMQLLVTNSHDGKSALKLNAGVYRAVCANGLVAGDDMYSDRVIHKGGDFQQRLTVSLESILSRMNDLKDEVGFMKSRRLSGSQICDYAEAMAQMRLKSINKINYIDVNSVLKTRRIGDVGDDLYTVFNRVQESVVRGGIKYIKEVDILDANGDKIDTQLKRGTTQEIKSIKQKLDVNRELWNKAIELVA